MKSSLIKVDAKGKPLSLRSTKWVAVFDPATNLFWSREHVAGGKRNWSASVEAASKVDLCGWTDWRAPTRMELLGLVDHSRYNPAIDVRFFPECKGDWEWTSTTAAYSPSDCAWVVGFSGGASGWVDQGNEGFVRAVRPGQLSGIGPRKNARKAHS